MTSNSTSRPLPGQKRLPREFIARHQRARIIAALAEETSERGYRAVTVADVVGRAGVARNTFYENFNSKEDCFLAVQDLAMSEALGRVVEAAGMSKNWPQRIRAGLAAFLSYVDEEPALSRACMVESLAAGPGPLGRYEESRQTFISLFRLGRDVSPYRGELPETLEESIVGGVFWILYKRLATSSEPISEMLPELVEFALTPYMGTEGAREAAREGNDEVKKLAN